jgi:prolyl-tRNA editing enzyme YbaK/EbsC (Cys-tRNA(Pro) deacylase)
VLTPYDLQKYLNANEVSAEIVFLDVPTPTVETAAQAVGASPQQIVKSILFFVAGQPVLAIACGTDYIDRHPIAALYGVGKKQVKLASPQEVLDVAGYEAGAMPPFAHLTPLSTLLDRRVVAQPLVFCGGGARNALMRLDPQDILRLTQARLMDLVAIPDS